MAKVRVMKSSNVQCEHGYVKIANELYDAISASTFKFVEFRILWTIMRYTYGWNEKHRELSARFIAESMDMEPSHVAVAIKNLIDRCILLELTPASYHRGRVVGINKYYEEWEVGRRSTYTKLVHGRSTKSVQGRGTKSVRESDEIRTSRVTKFVPQEGRNSSLYTVTKSVTNKTILKDKLKDNKEAEDRETSAALEHQTKDDVLLLDGMYYKWCMENLKYCPSEFDRRESVFTELLKTNSFDYLKQRLERFFVTTNKWVCNETDRGIEVFKRFVDKHIDEPRVPPENHEYDHLTT